MGLEGIMVGGGIVGCWGCKSFSREEEKDLRDEIMAMMI